MVEQVRGKGAPTLILDSGDLFFSAVTAPEHMVAQWRLQAEFLVNQFNVIGCDGIGIGENDFALGLDRLQDLQRKAQFPFINSNIVDAKSGALVFTPYIVKDVGKVRVGIFGIIDPSLTLPEGLKSRDAKSVAKDMVKVLRKKADFIVMLSHQGLSKDVRFAEKVFGIDLIVSGHDGARIFNPRVVKNTLIVHGYEKGKYIGVLDLDYRVGSRQFTPAQNLGASEQERASLYKHRLVPLDKELQDGDREIYEAVQAFKDRIGALAAEVKETEEIKVGTKTSSGNRIVYGTDKNCKSCHSAQYDTWKQSKHASAIIPLYIRNQHLNPACVQCHSVGFQEKGGFSNVAKPFVMEDGSRKSIETFLAKLINKDVSELPKDVRRAVKKDKTLTKAFKEKKYKGIMIDLRDHPEFDQWIRAEYIREMEKANWQRNFIGVQCENCHSARGVMNPKGKFIPHVTESGFPKKVVENSCLQCHTASQSPHFDFAKERRVDGEKNAEAPFQCKRGVF